MGIWLSSLPGGWGIINYKAFPMSHLKVQAKAILIKLQFEYKKDEEMALSVTMMCKTIEEKNHLYQGIQGQICFFSCD